jgi:cytochrome c biogenesis factor
VGAVRKWLLMPRHFLTFAIVMRGWGAYEFLGWG